MKTINIFQKNAKIIYNIFLAGFSACIGGHDEISKNFQIQNPHFLHQH